MTTGSPPIYTADWRGNLRFAESGEARAALPGGQRIAGLGRPLLALDVCHRIDRPWRIPLRAREAPGDSRLPLRSYCLDGLDSVCYAVPPERWRAGAVSA